MKSKLSPAMVVSLIALFVALGGSAVAARHYVITSSSQVKNGALKAVDLSRSARRALRGARGPVGPAGMPGPPGPSTLGHLTRVDQQKTLAPGAVDSVDATCPAGQNVVSGGFQSVGADSEVFFADTFGSPNTWSVGLDNFDSTLSATVDAIAFCAPAGSAVAATARSSHARAAVARAVAAELATHR
jgi:hypothetical protein